MLPEALLLRQCDIIKQEEKLPRTPTLRTSAINADFFEESKSFPIDGKFPV